MASGVRAPRRSALDPVGWRVAFDGSVVPLDAAESGR
jgi:hypothetical protein